MKKTNLLVIALIMSFLLGTGISIASPDDTTSNKANGTSTRMMEELRERRDEVKNQIEKDKENLKNLKASSTLSQEQKQQILKEEINKRAEEKLNEQKEKATKRFTEAVEKLDGLIIRVESRIAKLEASSTDMTISKNFIAIAKTQIITAKEDIATLGNMVIQLQSSTTKKVSTSEVRKQEMKIKGDLKLAQKSIVDAVNSMKPGRPEDKATTTKK